MAVSASTAGQARCLCGRSWLVPPRPDGTFPQRSRCAASAGGCGRSVRVHHRSPAALPVQPAAVWNPPSEARKPSPCGEPCPHCGADRVFADPRGTIRLCLGCGKKVIPPGVLAPYERGGESGEAVTRTVRSQRERDDDAKQTVIMAGEFLRRVAAMLADPHVHPRSADLLRWYDEEITAARGARDAGRLAELAAEFADDQQAGAFRRQHWWQGQTAVTAGLDDGPGDDDYGHYDDYNGRQDHRDQEHEPRRALVLATPASIAEQQHRAQDQPMTWHQALSAAGWRLSPADGGCQVVERGALCGTGTSHHIGDAWICGRHHQALASVIRTTWQRSQARTA